LAAREGTYAPWWKTIDVVMYGWDSVKAEAKADGGTTLKIHYDTKARALHVEVPASAGKQEIRIRR